MNIAVSLPFARISSVESPSSAESIVNPAALYSIAVHFPTNGLSDSGLLHPAIDITNSKHAEKINNTLLINSPLFHFMRGDYGLAFFICECWNYRNE